jgi:hypothetical protein
LSGGEAARRITFTSALGVEHRGDLERLLFFNPDQPRLRAAIARAVERFGTPSLFVDGQLLRVGLDSTAEMQALYVLEQNANRSRLVGAMLYLRPEPETVVLAHIAVQEDYMPSGIHGNDLLALRMIVRLRQVTRQIRGVRSLVVFYGEGGAQRIPVRSRE